MATFAAVAGKVAVAALAGMVKEAGTVTAELLLARETVVPPVGAGWFRVTVQALAAPTDNAVGVQVNEEIPMELAAGCNCKEVL